MAYIRKTVDEYNVMGHYGHGWETLTSETTYSAAKAQVKCYRENEGGRYKIVIKRVKL
jgi:hypothetical protein